MTDQLGMDLGVVADAELSRCGRYRYELTRTWDPLLPAVLWVMLNPSTADASKDDQTIRKCMKFARSWGYGGIVVGNLYAFRATDPDGLLDADDPVGPENDVWLAGMAELAGLVVAAWGAHRMVGRREPEVLPLLAPDVHCLRVTKDHHPAHPLYIPDRYQPRLFARQSTETAA